MVSSAFVGGFLSRRILRKPRASTALYKNPTSRLLWLWFRSNPILSLSFFNLATDWPNNPILSNPIFSLSGFYLSHHWLTRWCVPSASCQILIGFSANRPSGLYLSYLRRMSANIHPLTFSLSTPSIHDAGSQIVTTLNWLYQGRVGSELYCYQGTWNQEVMNSGGAGRIILALSFTAHRPLLQCASYACPCFLPGIVWDFVQDSRSV